MLDFRNMPKSCEDNWDNWLSDGNDPSSLLDVFEYIRDNFDVSDVFSDSDIEDAADSLGMRYVNDGYEDAWYYDRI